MMALTTREGEGLGKQLGFVGVKRTDKEINSKNGGIEG